MDSIVDPPSNSKSDTEIRTHLLSFYHRPRFDRSAARMAAGQACVYRMYGLAGPQLLYVGATENAERRFAQHANDKPWWREVSRIDQTIVASKGVALQLEDEAIRTESPLYNRTGPWSMQRKTVQRRGLPIVVDEVAAHLGMPA